jgi:hypothetical protein
LIVESFKNEAIYTQGSAPLVLTKPVLGQRACSYVIYQEHDGRRVQEKVSENLHRITNLLATRVEGMTCGLDLVSTVGVRVA